MHTHTHKYKDAHVNFLNTQMFQAMVAYGTLKYLKLHNVLLTIFDQDGRVIYIVQMHSNTIRLIRVNTFNLS